MPGGYYSGTLVTVVTAVLKAVSLSGGHTVATELRTNMGTKQSSSLTLAMHACTLHEERQSVTGSLQTPMTMLVFLINQSQETKLF